MHTIEPFYRWRDLYVAAEDENSPFYGREYSEFVFSQTIYNYLIHPQWDSFGSPTLYLKILYADYTFGYAIIEMIGEWNDCIDNDIMYLKREIIDKLMAKGISKFIVIGENVLNFHGSDDCYYEEWFEDVQDDDGWVVFSNFREHVMEEMDRFNLNYYINYGQHLNNLNWRTFKPPHLFWLVEQKIIKELH